MEKTADGQKKRSYMTDKGNCAAMKTPCVDTPPDKGDFPMGFRRNCLKNQNTGI